MSYRNRTIYVTDRTLKRLEMVIKLYPEEIRIAPKDEAPRDVTRDEQADAMLNQAIERVYPEVIKFEKKLQQVEKDFLAKMKNNVDG